MKIQLWHANRRALLAREDKELWHISRRALLAREDKAPEQKFQLC